MAAILHEIPVKMDDETYLVVVNRNGIVQSIRAKVAKVEGVYWPLADWSNQYQVIRARLQAHLKAEAAFHKPARKRRGTRGR
jgi:hypothetical protein